MGIPYAVDMYILSICIAYSVHKVAKVKCGYQCAFCMGKSVTPPTFFRRSIGDPVQLFRDPCELHPGRTPKCGRQPQLTSQCGT